MESGLGTGKSFSVFLMSNITQEFLNLFSSDSNISTCQVPHDVRLSDRHVLCIIAFFVLSSAFVVTVLRKLNQIQATLYSLNSRLDRMEVTEVRVAKVEEDDVDNDEVHADAKNNVPTVEHSIDTDVDAGVERAQEYQRTFDGVYAWAQKIRDTTTNSTPPSLTFEAIETPSNALFRLAWTPDSSPILHIEVSINTKFHDLVLGCSDPNRFTEYNRVFFPIKDLTTIDEDTKIVHGRTKSFFPGLSKQRDFVTAVQRRKTLTSLVLLHSAAPPEILPPTDQYVRAEAVQGAIVLEKEGETKCRVTIITHLDLKFSEWMTRVRHCEERTTTARSERDELITHDCSI